MTASEPMILPNLVVIGAARAGTTSLFHWFQSHPDVCGSSKKETNFLEDDRNSKNVDANYRDHGLAAYAKLFQHCRGERIRIDATPSYYHSQTALDVLTSMEPSPWVILSLRDPVDQLFSFYRFDVFTRKKVAPETTFADYLDSDRGREFIAHVRYADFIEPWKALNDHFKVLIFEEWTRSPGDTMRGLFEWIGLAAPPEEKYDVRNRSRETRSRWFHLMALRMRRWIPSAVQPALTRVYSRMNTRRPAAFEAFLAEQLRANRTRLDELFQPSNERLLQLLDRPSLPWKCMDRTRTPIDS